MFFTSHTIETELLQSSHCDSISTWLDWRRELLNNRLYFLEK